jgi:tRNA U55 pseudouridine synthase TruB
MRKSQVFSIIRDKTESRGGFAEVYKPQGMLLSELVSCTRQALAWPSGWSVTYAGRLDPLACGRVYLLGGDLVHEKEVWQARPKTYCYHLSLGILTDTGDVWSIPEHIKLCDAQDLERVRAWLVSDFSKITSLPYPWFSSKPLSGKPLFLWAREPERERLVRPRYTYTIYDHTVAPGTLCDFDHGINPLFDLLKTVPQDFRQELILKTASVWQDICPLLTLTGVITASAGWYVRSLPEIIYRETGIPTTITFIERLGYGDNREYEGIDK